MNIQILNLVEGAKQATGLTIIIDVFRAFTVECYAYAAGAEKIIPVGDINLAYKLKEENPDYLLVGERKEKKPEGFDCGNSPSEILKFDLKGKTIVHTTSAGTQGMVNAVNADEVLSGSFVNAGAITEYIRKKQPKDVSLVGMGYSAKYPVEEDVACAEYIANALQNRANDHDAIRKHLRETSGSRFFIKEKQHFAPEIDFDLCLNFNKFPFVLKRYIEDGQMVLRKIDL